jgi:hypothetical protein
MEINYLTENPSRDYATAIRAAKTQGELVKAILPFKEVADDALIVARAMKPADFPRFKKDLVRASRNNPKAWIDKFNAEWGAIAMPVKLMFSTLVAAQFSVPWGCAFIRCEEEGWPELPKSQAA